MKLSFKVSTKFVFIFLLYSNFGHALVDYSENTNANKGYNKVESNVGNVSNSSSLIWKSDLSIETNYEMLKTNNENLGLLNLSTHFQTPVNIYFDLNYWHAKNDVESGAGNSKFILGFNWLKIGNQSDMATLNLFGGMKFSGNSKFASTSNNKIFGIETTKKFSNFGLGLGYELTITSTPKGQEEMAVGNIQKIEVSSGWMATNDIQFELSIENFKINKSNASNNLNALNSELSFSTISPKINLQIFPAVNFELGARYPMNRAKSSQDLAKTKLYDLHGLFSSSVFSGLNLSI